MKSICRALLVLNLLYCTLAMVQEGLPGWHMFSAVESLEHELRDRDGQLVDVHAWLPRGANIVDRTDLRNIVALVCARESERGPFTYSESGAALTLDEDCRAHAAR
jgi:hypothetical protein